MAHVSTAPKNPLVFVGTYTEPEGSQSEGIYVYRMNPFTGELILERTLKGIVNPSFLAFHPQRDFLYAVNEVKSFENQPGGGVSAISMNADKLIVMNHQS